MPEQGNTARDELAADPTQVHWAIVWSGLWSPICTKDGWTAPLARDIAQVTCEDCIKAARRHGEIV